MPKERLDVLLVQRGLAPTRQKAQALILAGTVLVNDQPAEKAGSKFPLDAAIRLRGAAGQYVGRGGEKIAPAFVHFDINLSGIVALDVGASTGGFTDCMLQKGAARVYAVDVGYNQLAHSLRIDPRVVVQEKTNARYLTPELFPVPPALAVIDVSFISVRKLLAPIASVLKSPAQLLVLVKPQFELEPELVGKGGVVRDEALHRQAISSVQSAAEALGLQSIGELPAGLRGQKKGNQEYFVYFCGS